MPLSGFDISYILKSYNSDVSFGFAFISLSTASSENIGPVTGYVSESSYTPLRSSVTTQVRASGRNPLTVVPDSKIGIRNITAFYVEKSK